MRTIMAAFLLAVPLMAAPAIAQNQNVQNEANKGIKTQNSGASGYVGDQDKPGAAANMPGDRTNNTSDAATSTSAQNSGAGIAGAPGNKNGPPPQKGTVGAASQNSTVQ